MSWIISDWIILTRATGPSICSYIKIYRDLISLEIADLNEKSNTIIEQTSYPVV